ncbi:30S ribosome-binding factor RbfA [Mesonia sp. K7]|uniref:30S ribosome-binding factor RbfA n=1 Tax=Mesonia sp. K7 TaxID=2218606 RepID=UPI000DA89F73|nr:30S ribosome-binding factor RbfA [Mesonia sp. K7]PZD79158.1 30S ribosome-binding factor RbfA [Mesonia sp. K7]
MEETNRQKKIGGLIQQDLAEILQETLRKSGNLNIIISVSKASVTSDLSIAKVYLSIFPTKDAAALLNEIKSIKPQIKHQLAQRIKQQMRKTPDLLFFLDDSLDYIENIDDALKGKDNPIDNPDLLQRRKKS